MISPHDAVQDGTPTTNTPELTSAQAAWLDLLNRVHGAANYLDASAGFRPWSGADLDVTEREHMVRALDRLTQSAAILRRVIAEEAAS
jgi:hypothetical protein